MFHVPFKDEDATVKRLQKNTHFNRMNQKSMKLLVDMAKNPETKKRLESKKVAASRFKQIIEKQKLANMVRESREQPAGEKKRSLADLLPQIVAAKRADNLLEKAKEEKRKTDELEMQLLEAEVHNENENVDDDEDGDYTTINKTDANKEGPNAEAGKSDTVNYDTVLDSGSDSEGHYDDVANRLSVPKVENDEWPEEDKYAKAAESIDVLF